MRQQSMGIVRFGSAGLLLALLLALLAVPAHAQPFGPALLDGGTEESAGNGIALDSAGNRYIAGSFHELATFGDITLDGRNDEGFVAKYAPDNTVVWARQIGGRLFDTARSVAVAADGGVYVTGAFEITARFPPFSAAFNIDGQGQQDAFLARYDQGGQLIWTVGIGGTGTDGGFSVAVDAQGNVFLAGLFSNQARFTATDQPVAATLESAGGIDAFISSYDAQGRLRWAQRAGGSGNDSARGVAVGPDGDVYVTGAFSDSATFGGDGATSLTSAGQDDIFVARFSNTGELRWARSAGAGGRDRGLGIAVDAQQNSYVTGFFTNNGVFGTIEKIGPGGEMFLAQLDAAGTFQRVVDAGGPEDDEGRGVAVAPDGTVYVTGIYFDDATFGDEPNTVIVRQTSPALASLSHVFVAAYSAELRLIGVEGAGSAKKLGNAGNDIVADSASIAHVTGVRSGELFGTMIGRRRASAPNGSDKANMFLVTFDPAEQPIYYFSAQDDGVVDGLSFADEDVLAFDTATRGWALLFDGSDVGLAHVDTNALHIEASGTMLLSFDEPVSLPGISGEVDDSDIVKFIPTTLGADTAGSFELFFDGSQVELTDAGEDIDAIGFLSEGELVISTSGATRVTDADNQRLTADDEDLLRFNSAGFGAGTSGSFELFFDFSEDHLGDDPDEGLVAVWFDPRRSNDSFFFSAGGRFNFGDVPVTGDGADVTECIANRLDIENDCFGQGRDRTLFDGSAQRFGDQVIDAFAAITDPSQVAPILRPETTPPELDPEPEPAPDPDAEVLYISSNTAGVVPGVAFEDEDILAFQPSTNIWALLFDGSDVGLGNVGIDGFHWQDENNLLMSFTAPVALPELDFVDDSDIVRFIPERLGRDTAGRFELFLDGSDVGLSDTSEDIDAISVAPDGRLVISTLGRVRVPAERGNLFAFGSDLLAFSPTSLGEESSGQWSLFFDGSSIDLQINFDENIAAVWIDPQGQLLNLSTNRAFNLDDELAGDGKDVFTCRFDPNSANGVCALSLLFDGDANQFGGESVSAFAIGDSGVLGDIGDAPAPTAPVFLPLVAR